MEFILLILKIILIAFLSILGLALLAVGIILFVPIRYELSGNLGDSWDVKLKGKLTYLLSAVKVAFSYEKEQFDLKLYLFGFEKKMQQEDMDDSVQTAEETEDAEVTFREQETSNLPEQKMPERQENTATQEVRVSSEEVSNKEESPKSKKKTRTKKENKKNAIDFSFLKEQLTDEHNKSVVRKIWMELCYLLRHFKFRKIVTDLVFATGDPATTGQVLGILCMIPVFYRYNFKVVPDFEADEAYIKGTFLVAGKVRLIHVFVTLLRLICDKEVRLVVKRILRLLEQ